MSLEPADVSQLEVPTQGSDLRRDIHAFVDYVRGREVKRSHRGNALAKTDVKRLAKLMSDADAPQEVDEEGFSTWVGFVDDVVLKLGFVRYDTEGEYAGYTSQEPSFPDNYIEFLGKPYRRFLAAKAAQQETTLLELLLKDHQGGASEFYQTSVLGRLDCFSSWGSATGVMPSLDFAAIRRFLLGLLAKCPTGQWLSTASLIAHLKKNHRYFLIPRKPSFKNNWETKQGRYGNFHESKDRWGYDIDIREGDEDAFERVEGRYIERFLEGIPLLLGYVDVAYAAKHARILFLKASTGRQKPRLPKTRVRLSRVTRMQLVCPDREFMDKLQHHLTQGNCPLEIDRKHLMLTYSKQYESEVSEALRRLRTNYQIEIEDVP